MTARDLRFTASAEADLAAIHDYLWHEASPGLAAQLLDDFDSHLESLIRYPLRGQVPPELEGAELPGWRQILIGRYRVIDLVAPKEVVVAVVADGRRDLAALLRERQLR